jgi:hypothetical protein
MTETYRRWRLPQLWEMLAADDAADAHLHLATLRRQQTALETQRDRLRTLRDQLAEAWPPEKSEASTAFIQRVNDMIRAMSETANGAAEVRNRVNLVVEALSQARTELAPLVEQYQRTADLPDHRVAEQSRKLLDERARRILMASDAAVLEPAAAMDVQLPVYARFSMQSTVTSPVSGSNSSGNSGGGAGTQGAGSLAAPRFSPPDPAIDPPDAGFGLAADVHAAPAVVPAATDATGLIGGPVDRSVLGPGRVLGGTARPNAVARPGSTAVNGNVGTHGVIGGASSTGRPAISTSGAGATAARGTGGVGGYRDRSFDEYAKRRRAPRETDDESWSVPQGVPPLIDTPPTRAHDPGPGIIGIDR